MFLVSAKSVTFLCLTLAAASDVWQWEGKNVGVRVYHDRLGPSERIEKLKGMCVDGFSVVSGKEAGAECWGRVFGFAISNLFSAGSESSAVTVLNEHSGWKAKRDPLSNDTVLLEENFIEGGVGGDWLLRRDENKQSLNKLTQNLVAGAKSFKDPLTHLKVTVGKSQDMPDGGLHVYGLTKNFMVIQSLNATHTRIRAGAVNRNSTEPSRKSKRATVHWGHLQETLINGASLKLQWQRCTKDNDIHHEDIVQSSDMWALSTELGRNTLDIGVEKFGFVAYNMANDFQNFGMGVVHYELEQAGADWEDDIGTCSARNYHLPLYQ